MKLLLFSFSTLLAASLPTYGQQKEITEQELFSMDLEQLMNVSIVSASKKSENLFDAPLSASVLTKEEIRRAGCSSLMEAFRLMPGLIVREQSSGNYDIHIRGLDNVAPNSIIPNIANTTTLVMIDNRPVYNYLQGGTFWETLPVDIADIDRIEVVRGPSSAMYGPNAVSGVINIITRKLDKVGFQGVANAQYGAFNTILANASLGYQFGPKLDIQVSGNYQSRDRQQDTYYDVEKNSWVNADQLNGSNYNSQVWFPSPSRAMDKYGVNGFVSYKPNGRTKLNLSLGSQDSRVQKVYSENGATPMSNSLSNSQYIDLKAEVSKLSAQVSFVNGTQDLTLGHGGRQYDFRTTDVTLEYNFTFKNLSLKPGLNYRQAWYDDRPYSDASKKVGIISGGYGLTTEAAFFRADYQLPGNKLRLTGGLRVDKFTHPGGLHASYQGGLTYKPSENHLLRAVYGRANRSPFIIDTYIDNFSIAELPSNDDNIRIIFQQHIEGNKNLALVNSEMIELGYRSKLSSHFQLDVEAFRTVTRDYTDLIFQKESYEDQGSTFYINYPVQIINLPLRVIQTGVTLSLNYVVSQFQVKPFVTCQDTRLADYAPYPFTPDGPAHPSNLGNPAQNNLYSGIGTQIKHQGTPSWYGGAYLNWQIGSKLNVNLNPYFYTGHTFYLSENVGYRDGERGIDAIRAKALINAKVSYQVYKGIDLFVGARNLLNNQAREFYRSDRAGASYQLGVNANF